MCPMLKFPHSSSETPAFRLLLPSEVVQNREMLLPAIRYLQHHARIEWAFILLHESEKRRQGADALRQRLDRAGLECDPTHIVIDVTSAGYLGTGNVCIPIAQISKMVLLSQRHVALDVTGKRQRTPSSYEFAQACGKDPPITANDPSRRFDSVEIVSGFLEVRQHPVCDTVPRIIDAIGRAKWAQRVTRDQLSTPEETGRLFGHNSEEPESV